MPAYIGSTKCKEFYIGSVKLKELYYGSTKIFGRVAPGTIVFESEEAGTFTFTIPATQSYEIYLVGGGSGGSADSDSYSPGRGRASSGASGAFAKIETRLTAGTVCTIVVGEGGFAGVHDRGYSQAPSGPGGTSTFTAGSDLLVTCTGGTPAFAIWSRGGSSYGGTGGTYTVDTTKAMILEGINGENGRVLGGDSGVWTHWGLSVFEGYGQAGQGRCKSWYDGETTAGVAGYIRIVAK